MPRLHRRGMTLLEVLLSLFLTAVVAVLMGGLVQLFLLNETRGRESLRQTQTARAILNMIADDIRTSVRYQPYDTSGLQQMLGSASSSMLGGASGMGASGMGGSGAGGAGGAGGAIPGASGPSPGGPSPGGPSPSPGGPSPGGPSAGPGGAVGGSGGPSPSPSPGGAAGGSGGAGLAGGGALGGSSGMQGGGSGAGGAGTGAGAGAQPAAGPAVIPPGIFGTASSIEIDVSRMPRPDEYVIQMGDMSRGTLGDMPSDIKTVGYYVQTPRSDGVLDPLARLTSQSATLGPAAGNVAMSGGLVRRSLDRAVTQFAYANGRSDQLSRTGEIVAPEILGIEFSYFNSNSGWQTQWDSTQMGLPHVVKVTIALQTESKSRTNPLAPGLMLSTINSGMVADYGIQFYSINVVIPGSALLAPPSSQSGTGTTSNSNGMSSVGL